MCNFTCNPNTEHSDDGLFMYVTSETVDKYPNLFGGRAASSKLVCENADVSIIS